jgi:cation/acetate symporter
VGNNDGILQFNEFRINPDAIVIATPEIAGLPYVIAGLVAAGGLAAALSTADGLLLAIANALSHDVYYRMIDRNAPTEKRMLISRVLLVIVAGLSAWFAASAGADILFLVAWAFSIAAAGLFAALVMGVWYKGTTNTGALVGMIVGYFVTFGLLLWTEFGGVGFVETFGSADAIRAAYTQARLAIPATIEAGPLHGVLGMWADSQLVRGRVVARFCGIANIAGGIFGVPLAFIVTYAVSKFTTQPTQAMQDFIDSIRVPRGNVKLADNSAVD